MICDSICLCNIFASLIAIALNVYIQNLKADITKLRQKLIEHPVYASIRTIEHLRIFMEHHVYAVLDFMSLLKSLQQELTCVKVPWIPVGSPQTRYLINEIVLGEESDVDHEGKRTSHFELYLRAMEQIGCNMEHITALAEILRTHGFSDESLAAAGVPQASAHFMNNTFSVIRDWPVGIQAAVFTFGREDLIPGMFLSFVSSLNERSHNVSILKYYLERHIEVDGDHHSHLGYEMTAELCGADRNVWALASIEVQKALQYRIHLWDAIYTQIRGGA